MSGGGRDFARVWAEQELQKLSALGLRRQLEPLLSPQGAVVRIGGESLLNFSSNDYLGLANDPRVSSAAAEAMERHGLGSGASRLVVGDSSAHHLLEQKLAGLMGAPSALLFNSGYAANVGILSALMGEGDVIFSDALNHASLIDGCRLSRADRVIYPHGDLGELDRLLASTPARRRLVCTDAVFSMDGDLAPLEGLVELCRRHGAALMVDEAHAVGVLGKGGAGLSDALGLGDAVDIRVGTLGKSLGAFGAFAVCAPEVRELLFNRARSLVFSTSVPASLCAAASRAVEIVEEEPELRETLWRNIHRFSDGLRSLGFPAEPRSPIFPLVLGEPQRAVEASRALRARGLVVKAIRPPTVPKGTSRLRFALSAAHREQHIDKALEAVSALRAGT